MDADAYQAVAERLSQGLRGALPGAHAQSWMAPIPRPGWDPAREAAPGRPAAVLVLLYPGNGDEIGGSSALPARDPSSAPVPLRAGAPTLIYTERTGLVERHKRQVSFPGGVIEERESPERAALREAFEETGIPETMPQVLGHLTPLFVPATGFTIQPIVAVASERPRFSVNPHEVHRLLEVRLTHLMDPRSLRRAAAVSAGRWRRVPYFDLDGTMLWGASAMVTAELLALLGWSGPGATPD